jgi:hypothetical protein
MIGRGDISAPMKSVLNQVGSTYFIPSGRLLPSGLGISSWKCSRVTIMSFVRLDWEIDAVKHRTGSPVGHYEDGDPQEITPISAERR